MKLEERLQILLVTYNREDKLKYTLDTILADKSPIRNCSILILDNSSEDGSSELLEEYCRSYSNLTHLRHPKNIGGNANICRAFELGGNSGKEYFWILCDDDKYDFSGWGQVERYMDEEADVICVADYVYPDYKSRSDHKYQILQLSFVPAGIYKSSCVTGDVLINMYDLIYTMFQQIVLVSSVVQKNGIIKVVDIPVVFNGLHFQDRVSSESLSLTRGMVSTLISERYKHTTWILGYVSALTLFNDRKFVEECLSVGIMYKDVYGTWRKFYGTLIEYLRSGYFAYFYELYTYLPEDKQVEFLETNKVLFRSSNLSYVYAFCKALIQKDKEMSRVGIIKSFTKKVQNYICEYIYRVDVRLPWYELLFSMNREGTYKVIRFLGLRIKFLSRKM